MSGTRTAVFAALPLALMACGRATSIPEGAQVVNVDITPSAVFLEPATVNAGDVYLVLDNPVDGSLTVVARKESETATPGPLSDAEIERVRSGDMFHTSSDGMDAGGCSPEQNAEDRGRMGPCGNVKLVVLAPGKYAIVGGAPGRDPTTGQLAPMAVLTVVP